jgi:imidazolonepropionase-like amidohydrolase
VGRRAEQTLPLAAIAAVVDEAHKHGAKVSIHSRGSGSTRDAALAGVDWIFHADLATDADLDAVAAAGIPIMPVFAQGDLQSFERHHDVVFGRRKRISERPAVER